MALSPYACADIVGNAVSFEKGAKFKSNITALSVNFHKIICFEFMDSWHCDYPLNDLHNTCEELNWILENRVTRVFTTKEYSLLTIILSSSKLHVCTPNIM